MEGSGWRAGSCEAGGLSVTNLLTSELTGSKCFLDLLVMNQPFYPRSVLLESLCHGASRQDYTVEYHLSDMISTEANCVFSPSDYGVSACR